MLKSTFIFKILLIFIVLDASAQSQDTTGTKKTNKIEFKFEDDRLFNGVRVGTDLAGIGYGFIANDSRFTVSNRYEVTGDFGFKRWFVNLDLGVGKFHRITNDSVYNSDYTSSGSYFRLGADYRVSKSAKSFLFVGGRFCHGIFNEIGHVTINQNFNKQDIYGPASETLSTKLSANWFEAVTGIKVLIWKNFYMGYTIRFKFLLPSQKIKEEKPLDIPGYGIANRNTNLGFSFNIMYRIPFGKDPEVPLKGR